MKSLTQTEFIPFKQMSQDEKHEKNQNLSSDSVQLNLVD